MPCRTLVIEELWETASPKGNIWTYSPHRSSWFLNCCLTQISFYHLICNFQVSIHSVPITCSNYLLLITTLQGRECPCTVILALQSRTPFSASDYIAYYKYICNGSTKQCPSWNQKSWKTQVLRTDLQTPIQISIFRGHYSSSKTDKKKWDCFRCLTTVVYYNLILPSAIYLFPW